MRSALMFVAAGTALAAGSRYSPASAQPQAPVSPIQQRPTFSPYLNLLRGGSGSSPALNYFGLVRPEIQFRQQGNMLQQQVLQNNQAIQGLNNELAVGADPSLPITGRGASFGYYSHYFPALGGAGGGTAGRIGSGSPLGNLVNRAGGGSIGQAPQRSTPPAGGAGRGGRR